MQSGWLKEHQMSEALSRNFQRSLTFICILLAAFRMRTHVDGFGDCHLQLPIDCDKPLFRSLVP